MELFSKLLTQGNQAFEKGKFDEAEIKYKKAIKLKPNIAEVHFNLAIIQYTLNKLDEAEGSYKKTISLKPDMSQAYQNLGTVYSRIDRLEEAEKYYKKAIEINPNYVEAYNNLGTVFLKLKKISEAELCYKKAIKIKPDFFRAHNNFAKILRDQGKFDESILSYKKALEIKPGYLEAHFNLGIIYNQIGKISEAEKFFIKVLELDPNYVEAHFNLGLVLSDLFRFGEAEVSFKKAIKLKPDFAEVYFSFANMLKEIKRPEEAIKNYEQVKILNPKFDYLLGSLIHVKMHLCIWDDYYKDVTELIKKIDNGNKASTPFPLHSLIDNPRIHRKCAKIFSKDQYPNSNFFPHIPPYKDHKKIKIGYFSPDFKNHAVSYLTAELYEIHNREKFEVHAFMLSADKNDEFNIRIKKGVDHFHNVHLISDFDVVKLARSLEIDIVIDLAGFTGGSRTGIFAMSAAPIQVSYIGYLGTMEADYIDYLIADKTIIPEIHKKYYSEKIVYLPSFQVNVSQDFTQNKKILDRKNFNIPEGVFVFCCFNNTYKITPDIFNCWARILKQVKASVLMLFVQSETAIKNLKTEINNRGIDPNRLIFVKHLDRPDYLDRYQVVDLFLDTFPYNGGATTSDALRMGVPVLTCEGESFASRMGASLLKATGLQELKVTSLEQYELLGIELGTNSKRFNIIKKKLGDNLATAQLYNTKLFVQQLEAAYLIMHKKYKNKLNLDNIDIEK